MKKNGFLTTLDGIFVVLWKLLVFAGRIVYEILHGIGSLFAAGWHRLGRNEPGWWKFFNGLFKLVGMLYKPVAGIAAWLKRSLDESARARRWFFICVPLLLVLVLWPPYYWGRWYEYQSGVASYYGKGFYFRRTASGEWFLPGPFYTAAHKTLPLGTKVLVVNNKNGRRVVVKINDRGPYVKGRIIDLSVAAAFSIGIIRQGITDVTIYTPENMRGKPDVSVWYFPFY